MLVDFAQENELRVAITKNGQLTDIDISRPGMKQKKGNIYKGTISSIEPSLDAVFVNYGSERHGFLPVKEISPEYFRDIEKKEGENKPPIDQLLKQGDQIVVQIDKEERGNKGAALTTYISLAGAYLVLMPNSPQGAPQNSRIF